MKVILLLCTSDLLLKLPRWIELQRPNEYRFEVCRNIEAAQAFLHTSHADAIIAEKYLGDHDSVGSGWHFVRELKKDHWRKGLSEYPVGIVVAVWNAKFEAQVVNANAFLAERKSRAILETLETGLELAEGAIISLPDVVVDVETPVSAKIIGPDCRIKAIRSKWGRKRFDLTPSAIESLLLLLLLLIRRNHWMDLDHILAIHNDTELYNNYLGVRRQWTYDALKMRFSRLRSFLINSWGEWRTARVLKSKHLEDEKKEAYRILVKSITLNFIVVPKKNRA